jgi:hypothetical protein
VLFAVSFQAVTATASVAVRAARNCASVGTGTEAFSGETARTTRLASPKSVRAAVFTSSAEIVGMIWFASWCSKAIPGLGSPVRK